MTRFFMVESLPDKPFSRQLFLESFGRNPFGIMYSFDLRSSLIVLPEGGLPKLESVLPGIETREEKGMQLAGEVRVMSMYRSPESIPEGFMGDVFDGGIASGFILMTLVPEEERAVAKTRGYIEKRLGSVGRNVGYSISGGGMGNRVSKSRQGRDFSDSDEAAMLEEMLESLNRSLLRNGVAYKISFAASGGEQEGYLHSKLLCIESHTTNAAGIFDHVRPARSLHFGQDFAERLVNLHGEHATNYIIPGRFAKSGGDIAIGNFMKDSVYDTGQTIGVSPQALNLGFMISGLPGSGKTRAAMAVLDSVTRNCAGVPVAVISPTDEWNDFALSHGMSLVRICGGSAINFFRCPGGTDVRRFYESLAMVLASASSAGPYRNPMEKCMLNAFRRLYQGGGCPDPIAAYDAIEESVISMHGKRTHAGVKYSKHGENIRSGLENLAAILQMPEYSKGDGLRTEELLAGGVVFDLSLTGAETRSYFYALVLNQIYSMASSFDSSGDDKLRLSICLEEAQTMLKDPRSPVVEDMKYRIQDFRKKGIGLMLLAHSVSDIEIGIRRLCQIKLYLKQAADVAETASKDLVFANADPDVVVSKLRHLGPRIGALSYVSKGEARNVPHDTVFVRTIDYTEASARAQARRSYSPSTK